MDRIIEVKVAGNYLKKDNKNAGVKGEANVTKLRITFDEGWDSFAKKITFWDARGANPVEITLTTNLLENIVKSKSIYLVPIPAEPMAEAGMLTFVIDGYIDGKRQRSVSDRLEVKDAPITDNAGEPTDPTPTQAEQLQKQIDIIIDDIQDAVEAKEDIENMSVSAEGLKSGEKAFVNKTEKDGVVNLHFGLPAGSKGDRGKDGYNPQKGVDYWTPEEKAEISDYVKERVGETEDAVSGILAIQDALIDGDPLFNITGAAPEIHTHSVEQITDFPTSMPPTSHTHSKSQITDFPTSMPASDVYSWAKKPNKPSYTASEVGAAAANHTHTPSAIGAAITLTLTSQSVSASESSWSYGNNWYYQKVYCGGLLKNDSPIIDVILDRDIDSAKLQIEAWSHIAVAEVQEDNYIVLYTDGTMPKVAFQMRVKVVR